MADVTDRPRRELTAQFNGVHKVRSVGIAGVHIDALSFDETVKAIIDHVEYDHEPRYVITPNAHHVVMYQRDPLLRAIYQRAFLVVPDGVPLLWAARLLGSTLNGRVNGTDLFEALCAQAAQRNLRIFLLGGREGAAQAAADILISRHPSLNVCGTYSPPLGFEQNPAEVERAANAVDRCRPHLLFVGLGAPKQEYWMFFHARRIGVPLSIGVGVSFEFVGGLVPRAPRWMQRSGLEWLFRLLSEPTRLWKRYLFGNLSFCSLVMRQYFMQQTKPKLGNELLG